MNKELEALGLSEKEAKVYLAALEIGHATAEQLSKQSGVHRSTTYVQIEELMEMGLMTTFEKDGKTYFNAESPKYLSRIIEKQRQNLALQEKDLEKLVPNLLKLYENAENRPNIRFFEGKEGFMEMRKETLKVKSKNMYVAVSHDHMVKVFSEQELDLLSKARADKKIHSRALYTKTGEDIVPLPPIEMRRVPKSEFPFEADVYIYDNHVAFASLEGDIMGVIIQSSAIAQSMLTLYSLAWNDAEKYQK